MSDSTRVRITSDGTPQGTRVTTEDGTLLKGIQMVAWQMSISGLARVQVEFVGVAVDLVGLVETDSSFPEDPTAIVSLAVPQEVPEGPGFPERAVAPEAHATEWYRCPECQTLYDDPDQVCGGDDIRGEHRPRRVVHDPKAHISEDDG